LVRGLVMGMEMEKVREMVREMEMERVKEMVLVMEQELNKDQMEWMLVSMQVLRHHRWPCYSSLPHCYKCKL